MSVSHNTFAQQRRPCHASPGLFARVTFRGTFRVVAVDARAREIHFRGVSKPKKAKPSDDAATPGAVIAAKIPARGVSSR